jgi:hypothetical protein
MVAAGAKGVPVGIGGFLRKINAGPHRLVTFLLAELRLHPYTVLRPPRRVLRSHVE